MELTYLISLLRTRWKIIAAAALIAVLVASLLRAALPITYRSTAALLIDPRGINPVSGTAPQEPVGQETVVSTYANVVLSEGVARNVIDQAALAPTRASLKAAWRPRAPQDRANDVNFQIWAARQLLKRVDVKNAGPKSDVLEINANGPDAEQAAALANAFAAETIRQVTQARVQPAKENAQFFEEQVELSRKDMAAAEDQLTLFQRDHGITSNDDRLDVEVAKLSSLGSQVVANQGLSNDAMSRARAASDPNAISPELIDSRVYQTLQTDVAHLETKVQDLATRIGQNHPDMITATAQLAEARSALSHEKARIANSLQNNNVVSEQRTHASVREANVQRGRVLEQNAWRVEAASMERDVAQKRRLYETAVQRASETRMEAHNQQADVRVLTDAAPMDTRSGPSFSVLLAIALSAGTVVGVLIVLLQERMAPRLRTRHEHEQLGMLFLAAIPCTPITASTPRAGLTWSQP